MKVKMKFQRKNTEENQKSRKYSMEGGNLALMETKRLLKPRYDLENQFDRTSKAWDNYVTARLGDDDFEKYDIVCIEIQTNVKGY